MTIAEHWLVVTGATVGQLTVQDDVAPETVVEVEAELSGECSSLVVLEIVALLVMTAPVCAAPSTVNVNAKIAVSFAGRVAIVQLIAPPPPGLGEVQVKVDPESCVSETKVVPTGTELESTTFCAASGPRLTTSTL